jgi:hypothetical protein
VVPGLLVTCTDAWTFAVGAESVVCALRMTWSGETTSVALSPLVVPPLFPPPPPPPHPDTTDAVTRISAASRDGATEFMTDAELSADAIRKDIRFIPEAQAGWLLFNYGGISLHYCAPALQQKCNRGGLSNIVSPWRSSDLRTKLLSNRLFGGQCSLKGAIAAVALWTGIER